MFTIYRIALHDDTKSYTVKYEHQRESGNKLESARNLKIINNSMRFQTARIRLKGTLMSFPAHWVAYTRIIRLRSHGNGLIFDQLKNLTGHFVHTRRFNIFSPFTRNFERLGF